MSILVLKFLPCMSRVLTIYFTSSYLKLFLVSSKVCISYMSLNDANISQTYACSVLLLFVKLKYLLNGRRILYVKKQVIRTVGKKGNLVMTAQSIPCGQPNNLLGDYFYRPFYKIVNKMFLIRL